MCLQNYYHDATESEALIYQVFERSWNFSGTIFERVCSRPVSVCYLYAVKICTQFVCGTALYFQNCCTKFEIRNFMGAGLTLSFLYITSWYGRSSLGTELRILLGVRRVRCRPRPNCISTAASRPARQPGHPLSNSPTDDARQMPPHPPPRAFVATVAAVPCARRATRRTVRVCAAVDCSRFSCSPRQRAQLWLCQVGCDAM